MPLSLSVFQASFSVRSQQLVSDQYFLLDNCLPPFPPTVLPRPSQLCGHLLCFPCHLPIGISPRSVTKHTLVQLAPYPPAEGQRPTEPLPPSLDAAFAEPCHSSAPPVCTRDSAQQLLRLLNEFGFHGEIVALV